MCTLNVRNPAQSGSPKLRETVFLKPEMVTDALYSELDLVSPTQRFVSEQVRSCGWRKQGGVVAWDPTELLFVVQCIDR